MLTSLQVKIWFERRKKQDKKMKGLKSVDLMEVKFKN